MSSTGKVKALVTGIQYMCRDVTELERVVDSQVEVVTPEEVRGNPSLGEDIETAFYLGAHGKIILDLKEEGLLPSLKLVCNHGVGVNHMPFDRLRAQGLRVTNTPGVLSDSTADMALGLMLASGRQFATGEMSLGTQEQVAIAIIMVRGYIGQTSKLTGHTPIVSPTT